MSSIASTSSRLRRGISACAFNVVSKAGLKFFINLNWDATLNQEAPHSFCFSPNVVSRCHANDMQGRHGGKSKFERSQVSIELRFKYLSGSNSDAVRIYEPGLMREVSWIQGRKACANPRNIYSHKHGSAGIDRLSLFDRINDLVHNSCRVMQERQKPNKALLLQFPLLFSLDNGLLFELKANSPNRASNSSNRTHGLHPCRDISGAAYRESGVRIAECHHHKKNRHPPKQSMHKALSKSVHQPLPLWLNGSKA